MTSILTASIKRMKVFVHGFWGGFIEKTDPVHCGFFLDLFQRVFGEPVEIGLVPGECDLLLESVFSTHTYLFAHSWKYTFLFYGEPSVYLPGKCGQGRINTFSKYSCILCGEPSRDNRINMPLFVPYMYCNGLVDRLSGNAKQSLVPWSEKNPVCAIISNPSGHVRNRFLERLERVVPIHYAGRYKTNVPRLEGAYNDDNMIDFVSNYKFIVSMENTSEGTYITEKIITGMLAGIVPIYWGSPHVRDYFCADRFLCLDCEDDATMDALIAKVIAIMNNEDAYMKMCSADVFATSRYLEGGFGDDMGSIARNISVLLGN